MNESVEELHGDRRMKSTLCWLIQHNLFDRERDLRVTSPGSDKVAAGFKKVSPWGRIKGIPPSPFSRLNGPTRRFTWHPPPHECMLSLSYPAARPWDCEDCSYTISPRTLLHLCCLQPVYSGSPAPWTGSTSTLLMTGPSCLPLSLWERDILVSMRTPAHNVQQLHGDGVVIMIHVSVITDDSEECAESWVEAPHHQK